MRVDLLLIVSAFFAVTLLAEVLGAPSTGQAASYGVVAFAVTTVVVIVRRPSRPARSSAAVGLTPAT